MGRVFLQAFRTRPVRHHPNACTEEERLHGWESIVTVTICKICREDVHQETCRIDGTTLTHWHHDRTKPIDDLLHEVQPLQYELAESELRMMAGDR